MSEQVSSLLEKLSLSHWYKYLLYVSGILLVLVVVFGSKIEQSQVISFSMRTIILSLFVWIFDDIFNTAIAYYYRTNSDGYRNEMPDEVKSLLWGKQIIHIVFFILWLIIASGSL